MTRTKLDIEWGKLCEEFDVARDADYKALNAVNQKFAAIGQGRSNTNPTDAELLEFEKSGDALENIRRRMSEFVKKHT